MAEMLGISASYLNLIEHNRRPLPAELLLHLASIFDVDPSTFAQDDDARLMDDLVEAWRTSDAEGVQIEESQLRDLVASSPGLARSLKNLFRAHHRAQQSARTLAERMAMPNAGASELGRGLLPTEVVNDLIQTRGNHFPSLETAAEALWHKAELDTNDLYGGLVRYLSRKHAVTVRVVPVSDIAREPMRRFDPSSRVLTLSRSLRPRTVHFQLGVQIALIEHRELLDEIVASAEMPSKDARLLATLALANYFAGAVLMPYGPFLEEAQRRRYDIEILGHRFRTSFEQVCHRLTTLSRDGAAGVPFHFVRVDIAGNIIKQFSASGIRFPHYGAGCSLWNVYRCFQQPGRIRIQVSRMPDETRFFCLATTIRKGLGGYADEHTVQAIGMGCRAEDAGALVYSDGIDMKDRGADVKIGVTCRLCERQGCAQRAFPAVSAPLRVSLNERGMSPYDAPRG
jgi:predicted transcriptional regulator/transcriptional regulator with XRE-family HTH domain